MGDLTPADLAVLPKNQLDPAHDLALVWDASAAVLKTVTVGNLMSGGFVNAVADGGVDNSGATPVSDALNSLLASVEAGGGGVVFLPPGIYRHDKLMRVGNNTTLLGAGRGATIIRSESNVTGFNGAYGSVGCIGKTRASIRSFTLDHQTNGSNTNGICLWPSDPETMSGTPSSFCSIVDCEVLGFNTHQYLIWNRHSNDSVIAFNYVDGGVTSYDPSSQQEGIEIFGGRRVIVLGNHVTNVGNAGITQGNTPDFPDHAVQDIVISDNIVSACARGIQTVAVYGPGTGAQILERVQIRGNTVQNCWICGIYLFYPGAGESPGTVVMRDVLVEGNTVSCEYLASGPNAFMFDIQTANATTEGCLISNNVFSGGRPPTGGAVQANRAHNSAWRGNRMRNASSSTHGAHIVDTKNLIFENNDIQGAGGAALVLERVDGLRVFGNRFADWNSGGSGQNAIAMSTVTNTAIAGNSFAYSGGRPGYCLQGSDQDCSGLAVSGNFLQFAVTNGVPEPVRVPGANASRGEVVVPNGSQTVVVQNNRVQSLVPVQVTQMDGAASAFIVQRSAGQFVIVRADNAGDARYCWEIRN